MNNTKFMISIQKPHTDNIFVERIKTIEWRTKPLPLGTYAVYETKNKGGCGKIIGQFDIVGNKKFNLNADTYRKSWFNKGCVPFEFLVEYANDKDILWANEIDNVVLYAKPKELSEFSKCGFDRIIPIKRPPQSYMYCKEIGD